jgi:hypothetical protein
LFRFQTRDFMYTMKLATDLAFQRCQSLNSIVEARRFHAFRVKMADAWISPTASRWLRRSAFGVEKRVHARTLPPNQDTGG